MTLDERGGVSKRLGQIKLNSSPFGGGVDQERLLVGHEGLPDHAGRREPLPR
jgi:hypothetical protein